MTAKRQRIRSAAIQLFSNDGINNIPTKQIAQLADVSEGLIFKHFESKDGLIKEVTYFLEERILEILTPLLYEEDPKLSLKLMLELPFTIYSADLIHWKLYFNLQKDLKGFQLQVIVDLMNKIIQIFSDLRYKHPEFESKLVLMHLEGLLKMKINGELSNSTAFKSYLLNKYYM